MILVTHRRCNCRDSKNTSSRDQRRNRLTASLDGINNCIWANFSMDREQFYVMFRTSPRNSEEPLELVPKEWNSRRSNWDRNVFTSCPGRYSPLHTLARCCFSHWINDRCGRGRDTKLAHLLGLKCTGKVRNCLRASHRHVCMERSHATSPTNTPTTLLVKLFV